MQGFKQFLLLEKSKSENKTAYEQLLPYKDREDIFISFTEINKIGINPKTRYDTPVGIYAYPIKEFWKEYNIDDEKQFTEVTPFGRDRSYIQVLQLVDDSHFINDLKTDYKEEDYKRDMEKLKKVYVDEDFLKNGFVEMLKLFARFYNIKDNSLMKMDIEDFVAYIKNHHGLSFQELYELKYSRMLKSKIGKEISRLLVDNVSTFDFYNIIDDIDLDANHEYLYAGRMWYVLYRLSETQDSILHNMRKDSFGKKSNMRWNNMMRYLGYDGVADRSGVGIIHENEPVQAVFFSVKPIKHIESVFNKERITIENIDNIFMLYNFCKKYDVLEEGLNRGLVLKILNTSDFTNKNVVKVFKKIIDCLHDNKILTEEDLLQQVLKVKDFKFNKEFFEKYNFQHPYFNFIVYAIKGNNFDFFKFLYDNEEQKYDGLLEISIKAGNVEATKYIMKNEHKKIKSDYIYYAVKSDNVNMFIFIEKESDVVFDYYLIMEYAIKENFKNVFGYVLNKNKYDRRKMIKMLKYAIINGDDYIYMDEIIKKYGFDKDKKLLEKMVNFSKKHYRYWATIYFTNLLETE